MIIKINCDLIFIISIIFLEVVIIVSSCRCTATPYLGYFKHHFGTAGAHLGLKVKCRGGDGMQLR